MIFSSPQEVDAYINCIRKITLKDQVEVFISGGGRDKFVSGAKTNQIELVKVACIFPQVPVELGVQLPSNDPYNSPYRCISIPRVILAANSPLLIYTSDSISIDAQPLFHRHYTGPLLGWTFKSVDENCRIAKIIKG